MHRCTCAQINMHRCRRTSACAQVHPFTGASIHRCVHSHRDADRAQRSRLRVALAARKRAYPVDESQAGRMPRIVLPRARCVASLGEPSLPVAPVCMHTCLCTCSTCVHVYILVCMHAYLCACMHTCVHVAPACMYALPVCMHAYRLCACMHTTCVHACIPPTCVS